MALEHSNPAIYSLVRPVFEKIGWDEMGGKRLTSLGEKLENFTGATTFSEAVDALAIRPISTTIGRKDIYPPRSAKEQRAEDIAGQKLSPVGGKGRAEKERNILIDKYSRGFEGGLDNKKLISELRQDFKAKKLNEHDLDVIDQNVKAGSQLVKNFKSASFENAKLIWNTPDSKLSIQKKMDLMDAMATKIDNLSEEKREENKEFIKQFVKDARAIVKEYKRGTRKEFGTK